MRSRAGSLKSTRSNTGSAASGADRDIDEEEFIPAPDTIKIQRRIEYDHFESMDDKKRLLKEFTISDIDLLCRDDIDKWYFRDSVMYNEDTVLILQYNGDDVVGLMVLYPTEPDMYYISMFCTQKNSIGLGRKFMNHIFDFYCRKKCVLSLEALPGSIGFYKKLGFVSEDSKNFYYTK